MPPGHPERVSPSAREENDRIAAAIDARVAHLNTTRAWPWQVPGVESVALDDDGNVRRYLATKTGLIDLGPA